MTASVIQLQARGAQDIYLNIDPEVRNALFFFMGSE